MNTGHCPSQERNTRATDAYGAIPDLACEDDVGNRIALIESKFWAPLTHHQPVTYWQGLPEQGRAVLLFIAPDYRVDQGGLWDELQDRLHRAGHELGATVTQEGLIAAQSKSDRRRLMLTTWQSLLDRMAQRARDDGDSQACFEIGELQGLAASAIKMDRPTRAENLKDIIFESINRVEKLELAATSGLSVGRGIDFYGRYIRLAGALAWLGIDYRAAKEMPGKLLWLMFYEDTGVEGSVTLEDVRSRLKGLSVPKLEWRDGDAHIPIDLPTGADRAKTLEAVTAQLERVAELIDPDGPTYR